MYVSLSTIVKFISLITPASSQECVCSSSCNTTTTLKAHYNLQRIVTRPLVRFTEDISRKGECLSQNDRCCIETIVDPRPNCGFEAISQDSLSSFDTNRQEFPWYAMFAITNFRNAIKLCSGVIVSDTSVLTTGACALSLRYHARVLNNSVAVLIHDKAYTSLKNITIHPSFDPSGNNSNNVAIVSLQDPILYNSNVTNVCLFNNQTNFPANRLCAIALTDSDDIYKLNRFPVSYVDPIDCTRKISNGRKAGKVWVGEDDFCTAVGDPQPCLGDIGSALVCSDTTGHMVLVGLATSERCNDKRFKIPATYSLITGLTNWIQSQIT